MGEAAATDVLIVGAGPVGLFAAFELGLFDMRCHLVDALDRPGGQCTELYADKPIYDVPGFPSLPAQELVDRLVEQVAPFRPAFTFGRMVSELARLEDDTFRAAIDDGRDLDAKAVVIAAGGGPFRSGRQAMSNEAAKEEEIAPASARRTRLGTVAGWGLDLHGDTIPVDTETFATSVPGIFAIGDVARYPGKLLLLLSGFHEAALMAQAVRRIVRPGGRMPFPYTTSSKSLHKKLGVD